MREIARGRSEVVRGDAAVRARAGIETIVLQRLLETPLRLQRTRASRMILRRSLPGVIHGKKLRPPIIPSDNPVAPEASTAAALRRNLPESSRMFQNPDAAREAALKDECVTSVYPAFARRT